MFFAALRLLEYYTCCPLYDNSTNHSFSQCVSPEYQLVIIKMDREGAVACNLIDKV